MSVKTLKLLLRNVINSAVSPFDLEFRNKYGTHRMFPESLGALKMVIPTPKTVIDVGVAHGTPALYDAFPASQSRYLLVEANPCFKEEIQVLEADMDAIYEPVFCGREDGEETFLLCDNASKASKYDRITSTTEQKKTVVPMKKLDTIMRERSLSGPCVLKIDVEGAELDVLEGATQTLKECEALIIETPIMRRRAGGSIFGETISFLVKEGFSVFDFAEMSYRRHGEVFLNMCNVIAVRSDNQRWKQTMMPNKTTVKN